MATFWDYSLKGAGSDSKNLDYIEDADAVENALILFFFTQKGEIINQPTKSGSLVPFLFKTLTTKTQGKLIFHIMTVINNDFYPRIILEDLSVLPDVVNKRWNISMTYYIPILQQSKTTNFELNRIRKNEDSKPVDIFYKDIELRNFVLSALWNMVNNSLKWNGKSWVWGKYNLVNLKDTDANFQLITELINSNFYDVNGQIINTENV